MMTMINESGPTCLRCQHTQHRSAPCRSLACGCNALPAMHIAGNANWQPAGTRTTKVNIPSKSRLQATISIGGVDHYLLAIAVHPGRVQACEDGNCDAGKDQHAADHLDDRVLHLMREFAAELTGIDCSRESFDTVCIGAQDYVITMGPGL